jgi:hypothetical protein
MRDAARELIKPRPEPTIVVSPEVVRATGHVILVAAVAAIGGFLFGFDTAVINGAVGSVQTAYGLYGLAALLSLFFVIRIIRETRGRELESISHQQDESLLVAS